MNEKLIGDLVVETQQHMTGSSSREFVEKFAELIVQECANELVKWKHEPFPYDPEFGARLIKQHFGVEL